MYGKDGIGSGQGRSGADTTGVLGIREQGISRVRTPLTEVRAKRRPFRVSLGNVKPRNELGNWKIEDRRFGEAVMRHGRQRAQRKAVAMVEAVKDTSVFLHLHLQEHSMSLWRREGSALSAEYEGGCDGWSDVLEAIWAAAATGKTAPPKHAISLLFWDESSPDQDYLLCTILNSPAGCHLPSSTGVP